MKTMLFLVSILSAQVVNAEFVLNESYGNFNLSSDLQVNGEEHSRAAFSASISDTTTGEFRVSRENDRVIYDDLSTFAIGNSWSHSFTVNDKEFSITRTIHGNVLLYDQIGTLTQEIHTYSTDAARVGFTDGLAPEHLHPNNIEVFASYEIEGPTETISGDFTVNDFIIWESSSPLHRWFEFQYDENGGVLDVDAFYQVRFDVSERTLFDTIVDGERIALSYDFASYTMRTHGSAVPEPNAAMALIGCGIAGLLRRRRNR